MVIKGVGSDSTIELLRVVAALGAQIIDEIVVLVFLVKETFDFVQGIPTE